MDFYERLAQAIADARRYYRMSQREVAEATGHAVSTISKWETNKAKPDAYDLHRLCKVFNLEPRYLLMPEERPLSAVEMALLQGAAEPPPRRRVPMPHAPARGQRRPRP